MVNNKLPCSYGRGRRAHRVDERRDGWSDHKFHCTKPHFRSTYSGHSSIASSENDNDTPSKVNMFGNKLKPTANNTLTCAFLYKGQNDRASSCSSNSNYDSNLNNYNQRYSSKESEEEIALKKNSS